jgi:cell division protein FtsI/penicillin-binding protein 2
MGGNEMNQAEKPEPRSRDHSWRYSFLGTMLLALPILIVLRMFIIQTSPAEAEKFDEQIKISNGIWKLVTPMRGQIVDKWGHILAANKTSYEIGIDLIEVKNPATIAETAQRVLGMDYATALRVAQIQPGEKIVHAVLQDNVSEEAAQYLEIVKEQMWLQYRNVQDPNKPSLSGLVFQEHLQRTYPEKSLASNLLGFLSGDGVGNFGVEGKYNGVLAGKKQLVYYPSDPILAKNIQTVPDGDSLILTFDRAVQGSIESLVDYGVKKYGAEAATIVVIAPRTGEILAMATSRRLDLNEYWSYGKVFPGNLSFNPAISSSYETGSVYKIFTMAAAIDLGVVKPDTIFIDRGVFEVGGYNIVNWNRGAWGKQTMLGCMQHSLNTCLAWVATQVGATNFYRYMQTFGIGHLTGIDLAGEATGRLKAPGDTDWFDMDLGVNAFGQGVSATPIQMAAGATALANDGKIMLPHIVRATVSNGKQHDTVLRVISAPIKPESAKTMAAMLAESLEKESSNALVDGYRVAGKTGTAEIPTPYGYSSNETNASFVGWGPVDDPQFLVYIWLQKPQASIWGSETAAPLFSEVVKQLVVLLNIPPDEVRHQLQAQAGQ